MAGSRKTNSWSLLESWLGNMRGVRFPLRVWRHLQDAHCDSLAAEITYNWMLALLPALISVLALLGLLGAEVNRYQELLPWLRRLVPADALALVQSTVWELIQTSSGGLAVGGLLGALWTASNGTLALANGMHRLTHPASRQRTWWQQRGIALILVVGIGGLGFLSANLILFWGFLLALLTRLIGLPAHVVWGLQWAGRIFPLIGLLGTIAFVYWIAPERQKTPQQPLPPIWPGALAFMALWFFISWLFKLYVLQLANYGKIYGSMGAIIVLMVWLYLTAYALLAGSAVNALYRQPDPLSPSTDF